jgi:hypothetical protein
MRGTWLSTLRAPAQTPDDSAPRAVLGPAIAGCGFREPLAPRLARPGRTMVAHRRTLSSPGRVAQRESARFTRERSLVRSQPRPFHLSSHADFGLNRRVGCAACAGNARAVPTPVPTSRSEPLLAFVEGRAEGDQLLQGRDFDRQPFAIGLRDDRLAAFDLPLKLAKLP